MGEYQVILLDQDDLMHPNTGESNFNESAYYNFYDRAQKTGGFVRLGNRPNEGYAEMTVCIYLPDGTVGFMFGRPEIKDNRAHDAGGLKFEVVKPFEHHRVTYLGNALHPEESARDGRAAPGFQKQSIRRGPVGARLLRGRARMGRRASREDRERMGEYQAERRCEHRVRARPSGAARTRGREAGSRRARVQASTDSACATIAGGPRYWQAPKYYRWLTMNFDETLGGMATITVQRDGSERIGGFIARKGQPHVNLTKVDIQTEFAGEQKLHDRSGHLPDRQRRRADRDHRQSALDDSVAQPARGIVTRIAEGMTQWRWDGKVGYGLSEYLDHIVE